LSYINFGAEHHKMHFLMKFSAFQRSAGVRKIAAPDGKPPALHKLAEIFRPVSA
jgi:hypothetical protein